MKFPVRRVCYSVIAQYSCDNSKWCNISVVSGKFRFLVKNYGLKGESNVLQLSLRVVSLSVSVLYMLSFYMCARLVDLIA